MKINFHKLKISPRVNNLFLVNLIVAVASIIIIFTLIAYFGLGRGDVAVFTINFSEKPAKLTGLFEQTLPPFAIYSHEASLNSSAQLTFDTTTLDIIPLRTPVVYGLVIGPSTFNQFCLVKTNLSLDLKSIGTNFELLSTTPNNLQSYRFDLSIEQLWWPGKTPAAMAINTLVTPSRNSITNLQANYTYVFPAECNKISPSELAAQAKFWLTYNEKTVNNYYNQQLQKIEQDPSYRDPGPR